MDEENKNTPVDENPTEEQPSTGNNNEGSTDLTIDPIPREDIIEDIEIPESAYKVETPCTPIRPLSHREYMHILHRDHHRRCKPPKPNDPIFMKEFKLGPDCSKYGCSHDHYASEPPHRCPLDHNPPPPNDYNEHNQFHRYDKDGNDTLFDPNNVYGCDYEEGHTHAPESYNGYGEQYTRTVYHNDAHGYDKCHSHHHHHHCHDYDSNCGYHNPNTPFDNRPMNDNNESYKTAVMFVEQETILSVRLRFVYASNECKEIIIREGNIIEMYYVDTSLLKLQHVYGKIVKIIRSSDNSKLYSLVVDCSEHFEHSMIRVPIANIRDIVILTTPSI